MAMHPGYFLHGNVSLEQHRRLVETALHGCVVVESLAHTDKAHVDACVAIIRQLLTIRAHCVAGMMSEARSSACRCVAIYYFAP